MKKKTNKQITKKKHPQKRAEEREVNKGNYKSTKQKMKK